MKHKIDTSSVLFTAVVTVLFFFLLGAVSISTRIILKESIARYDFELYIWINAFAQLVLTLALIMLSRKIGLHRNEDYAIRTVPKGLYMGLVCLIRAFVFFAVNLWGNIGYAHIPKPTYLLGCLTISFTTGFFEEVLCRGFAYNNLTRHYGNHLRGVKKSIILSASIFGVLHIVNLSGYSLAAILETTSQIISAILIGIYFSLIYIQSKSMWAVVLNHALADGATFVLYSILSIQAFQTSGTEPTTTSSIVIQTLMIPLISMIPIVISIYFKWRRFNQVFETGG